MKQFTKDITVTAGGGEEREGGRKVELPAGDVYEAGPITERHKVMQKRYFSANVLTQLPFCFLSENDA